MKLNVYRYGKKVAELPDKVPGWKQRYAWGLGKRFAGFTVELGGEGEVTVLPLYYTTLSAEWAKGIVFINLSFAPARTLTLVLATHAPFIQVDGGKNDKVRERYAGYTEFWDRAMEEDEAQAAGTPAGERQA